MTSVSVEYTEMCQSKLHIINKLVILNHKSSKHHLKCSRAALTTQQLMRMDPMLFYKVGHMTKTIKSTNNIAPGLCYIWYVWFLFFDWLLFIQLKHHAWSIFTHQVRRGYTGVPYQGNSTTDSTLSTYCQVCFPYNGPSVSELLTNLCTDKFEMHWYWFLKICWVTNILVYLILLRNSFVIYLNVLPLWPNPRWIRRKQMDLKGIFLGKGYC